MNKQRSAFTAGLVAPERPTNGEGPTGGAVQAFWDQSTTFKTHSAGVASSVQTIKRAERPRHLWTPDNRAVISEASMPALLEWTNAMLHQHGADPGTLAQAAAHEAGHLVIGKIIGLSLEGARLTRLTLRGREVWGGCTRTAYPPGHSLASGDAAGDAAHLFGLAAFAFAGFAGELAAGVSHPSSSLDERFVAAQQCEALITVVDWSRAAALLAVATFCKDQIVQHRGAFDAVRVALFAKRRLQRIEISRMLAGVMARGVVL